MNKGSVAALALPNFPPVKSPALGFGLDKLDTLFTPRSGSDTVHTGNGGRMDGQSATTATPGRVQAPAAGVVTAQAAEAAALPAVTLSSAEQDRLSVQAALGGDQTAFAELVTRYQTAVFNMAYRMLGNPSEAEDAAQEVFVRAWNQLHTFQLDRRFSTWLLSIASHYCIDLLRRRKPSAPLDDVALFLPSNEPEPEELALRNEQSRMVLELLNTLPDKYRSVTVLRYYNDLSYDEIAHATGLTESAVKTQLHRARKMLAEQLRGGTS